MFDAVLAACAPSTRVAIAVDLTGPDELVRMQTVQQWKAVERPSLQRQPAVFCLLAA